jgi:hypothetical protein
VPFCNGAIAATLATTFEASERLAIHQVNEEDLQSKAPYRYMPVVAAMIIRATIDRLS